MTLTSEPAGVDVPVGGAPEDTVAAASGSGDEPGAVALSEGAVESSHGSESEPDVVEVEFETAAPGSREPEPEPEVVEFEDVVEFDESDPPAGGVRMKRDCPPSQKMILSPACRCIKR